MTIADGSAVALAHEKLIVRSRLDDDRFTNPTVLKNGLRQCLYLIFRPDQFIQSCFGDVTGHLPDEVLNARIARVEFKLAIRNPCHGVGDLLALDHGVVGGHNDAPCYRTDEYRLVPTVPSVNIELSLPSDTMSYSGAGGLPGMPLEWLVCDLRQTGRQKT